MPTLNWDKRQHAEKTLTQVPYRLLKLESEFRSSIAGTSSHSDNILVQGDNLEALNALLPLYEGQVKCIFIDPPYNTGSAFTHYDDNLEHNVWLAMMYPRLKLLHRFLCPTGFIAVHLDDAEGHYLKVMMDEICLRENYLVTIYSVVRYAEKTLKQDMDFHKRVEQVHIYRKSIAAKPNRPTSNVSHDKYVFSIHENGTPIQIKLGGKIVDVFKKGDWSIQSTEPSVNSLKEIWATGSILDGNSSGRFFRDYLAGRTSVDGLGALYKVSGIGDDELPYRYFTGPQRPKATKGKYYQGVPINKRNLENIESSPIDNSYDFSSEFGNCRTEGDADFRSGKKPETYLKLLLETFTNQGDLVLDSFLGSGSTAAVAQKMGRRWIGIEMGEHARTHCVPRLQNVINGDQTGISESHRWQGGGGFAFYTLGEAVFLPNGHINPNIKFDELAQYVWQSVTRSFSAYSTPKIDEKESQIKTNSSQIHNPTEHKDATPLLGIHNDVVYFLLYNGILRDRRPEGGNVLTPALWHWLLTLVPSLQAKKIRYVVYGEACQISKSRRDAMGLEFKQMPYKLTKV